MTRLGTRQNPIVFKNVRNLKILPQSDRPVPSFNPHVSGELELKEYDKSVLVALMKRWVVRFQTPKKLPIKKGEAIDVKVNDQTIKGTLYHVRKLRDDSREYFVRLRLDDFPLS